MSRGISAGKQGIKDANTSKCGRVCLFSQNNAKCTVRVSTIFASLLFAVRTSTVATAFSRVTRIASTQNLVLSSLQENVLHFLLSRINKLDGGFFYRQILALVCPMRNNEASLFSCRL